MLDNKLAMYRGEKKWTQQQLAEIVNVSRQTITNIEKNKYNPSLILAFKISNAFGRSILEVFSYEEDI
ncbi:MULTISPECIES: helix-turn-helix transcriptional regulator [unclassified Exiguobacterium]|uniref:helix-turn-helix transcriptional regulator n=2 Tax=Exiguobacterium TaxID=33986 RepID=UPI001BE616DD|nr:MULTISPECIES: helix-turn-helix transcriptional regulator [unclassified Exiguobacterium]